MRQKKEKGKDTQITRGLVVSRFMSNISKGKHSRFRGRSSISADTRRGKENRTEQATGAIAYEPSCPIRVMVSDIRCKLFK